jgi:hypothetical protein
MLKLRLAALMTAIAFLGVFVLAPMSASAAAPANQGTAALSGTTAAGDTVTGTVTNLVASLNRTTGVTTITGTFTDAATGAVSTFTTTLTSTSGSCQILHLVLGPLDLNLLGLQVHLNQVVLDITAQSGPGNLLGNLLCAVAHLLDSNAAGQALTNLLNLIFGLLG